MSLKVLRESRMNRWCKACLVPYSGSTWIHHCKCRPCIDCRKCIKDVVNLRYFGTVRTLRWLNPLITIVHVFLKKIIHLRSCKMDELDAVAALQKEHIVLAVWHAWRTQKVSLKPLQKNRLDSNHFFVKQEVLPVLVRAKAGLKTFSTVGCFLGPTDSYKLHI